MTDDERKAKARAYTAAYRARQKAAGRVPAPATPEQLKRQAEAARRHREKAKAEGRKAKAETWWLRNRDRHRENVRTWRAENVDKARSITRDNQRARRSTPWGAINNRLWATIHSGVRRATGRRNVYSDVLGYTWADLRSHLEAQFTDGMTWENWGEVWELDHIEPLSAFHYVDLLDPLFKEAWRLDNLRPLLKHLNQSKGSKREPQI